MAGEIPHVNWAAYSLRGKYQMMHEGPGSEAVAPAARTLGVLAPEFGVSSDKIQAALRGTGAEWQGQAATAFSRTMRQAAEWAQRSSQASKAGADQVHGYGSSYDTTRNKIPSPVEIGENSFLGQLADETGGALRDSFGSTFGVQSDYAKRVAAHRAADEMANQALVQHENLTRQAVASFPESQPTPPITNPAASATSVGGHGAGGGGMDTSGGVGSGGGHGGAAHPGDSTPTASAGWTPVNPPAGARPDGGPGGSAGRGGPPGAPAPDYAGTGIAGAPAPVRPLPAGGGGWRPSAPPLPTGTWGLGTAGPGFGPGGSGLSPAGSGYGPSGPSSGARPSYGSAGTSGYGAGSHGTSGYGMSGGQGAGGMRELGARGGPAFAEPSGRPGLGPPGLLAEGAAAGRGVAGMGGMAGMPPMMGGAGLRGQELEHHNNVFIPSDEPFAVDPGDDLVPPVLGEPGAQP